MFPDVLGCLINLASWGPLIAIEGPGRVEASVKKGQCTLFVYAFHVHFSCTPFMYILPGRVEASVKKGPGRGEALVNNEQCTLFMYVFHERFSYDIQDGYFE